MKPRTLIDSTLSQAFGNAEFRSTPNNNQKTNTNLILFVIFVIFLLGCIAIVFSFQEKIPASQTKHAVVKTPSQIPASQKYIEAYVWTAKLKLEDLQLNHRLEIGTGESNILQIEGNISPEELPRWDSFLAWYESKDGFPELNHSVVADAVGGNIPKLKSIWFNKTPTAYFSDGRFGTIGSILDDGWKIVSIEPWAVFIERNGKTITLAF